MLFRVFCINVNHLYHLLSHLKNVPALIVQYVSVKDQR